MAARKRTMKNHKPPKRVRQVIRHFGTRTALAKELGVTRGAIRFWTRIPAEHVLHLERASNGALTRHDMRPDLYGPA